MTTMRVTLADRTGEPLSHTQKSTCTMQQGRVRLLSCCKTAANHAYLPWILRYVLGTAHTWFDFS